MLTCDEWAQVEAFASFKYIFVCSDKPLVFERAVMCWVGCELYPCKIHAIFHVLCGMIIFDWSPVTVSCCVADILKANDEVIRVMALYEDTVQRPDVDSFLIDNATHDGNASRGQYSADLEFSRLKSRSRWFWSWSSLSSPTIHGTILLRRQLITR